MILRRWELKIAVENFRENGEFSNLQQRNPLPFGDKSAIRASPALHLQAQLAWFHASIDMAPTQLTGLLIEGMSPTQRVSFNPENWFRDGLVFSFSINASFACSDAPVSDHNSWYRHIIILNRASEERRRGYHHTQQHHKKESSHSEIPHRMVASNLEKMGFACWFGGHHVYHLLTWNERMN